MTNVSWRSLMEMARCIRAETNNSKSLWPYAARHAQYLRNRSYQRRTSSTAYELFSKVKPDLSKLHAFGAPCIIYAEGHRHILDICEARKASI